MNGIYFKYSSYWQGTRLYIAFHGNAKCLNPQVSPIYRFHCCGTQHVSPRGTVSGDASSGTLKAVALRIKAIPHMHKDYWPKASGWMLSVERAMRPGNVET